MIRSEVSENWLLDASTAVSRLHPLDGSIRLLRLSDKDGGDKGEAAYWPLAVRDRALLELAREIFGDTLDCIATCPCCGEDQEFELSASEIADDLVPPEPEDVQLGDWDFALVPLTSNAVADAARTGDLHEAERVLTRAAVANLRRAGNPVELAAIPKSLEQELGERINAREAQGEVLIGLACEGCGHQWSTSFGAGSDLLQRIDAAAMRLLSHVAILARAFGWTERETLALPLARRRAYLDMVTA